MAELQGNSDKLLVKELILGNEKAFRSLYETYGDDVYGYSLSMLKSKPIAEEVVQEVFLKVWKKRDTLSTEHSFKAFVFTMARNQVFNVIKKADYDRKLRKEIFYKYQTQYNPVERKLREQELEIIKQQAIDLLPPKRKLIFEMSRNQGMSYDAISQELDISISTVKTQMSKALETIRTFIFNHQDVALILSLITSGWAG